MVILWQILVQFIFRLSFGMALAMGLLPARLVSSGYYRVQLWVLMGLNTLAALAIFSNRQAFGGGEPFGGGESDVVGWGSGWLLGLAVASAVSCYAGAVVWLYEREAAGKWLLLLTSALGLAGALGVAAALAGLGEGALAGEGARAGGQAGTEAALAGLDVLDVLDVLTSGLLLGITLAAMLLGHWYLNTPTMQLLPLQRLVLAMLLAVAARAVLCGVGLGLLAMTDAPASGSLWIFIALRWLAGLIGTAGMGAMAWYTLKVPNTQSATGILYAGVILAFIGELTSQLLSASLPFPV